MPVKLNRVIIIGAGIGGLTAAIGLRRLGLDVEVYEQAPAFGDVGAGLTLWANAVYALDRLGIPADTLDGAPVGLSELLDSHGRSLSRVRIDQMTELSGVPSLAVHRADLHQVLLAALPSGTVHTGAVFTRFEQDPQTVTACFSDGSSVNGDLLIGADGIRSAVRQQLFPEVRLRYSGYIAWRGVVAASDLPIENRTSETWGLGVRFGIVPIGKSRIYWFATANLPAGLTPTLAERRAELRRRFHGWHAPIEALIAATPEERILYNDIYDFPPLSAWSNSRVTLLGDAAHPTTPNTGQGACQAIESSVMLSRCLAAEHSLTAALSCYERQRMPRTAWITNQSWRLGQVAQLENPTLCALRDFVMRAMPASAARAQIIKLAGYTI